MVNTSGLSQYLVGTPSLTPAVPTLLATQLLVSIVSVPAAGVPIISPPDDCCIPDGTVNGQIVRWDNAGSQWLIATHFTTLTSGTVINTSGEIDLNGLSGFGYTARVRINSLTPRTSVLNTDGLTNNAALIPIQE